MARHGVTRVIFHNIISYECRMYGKNQRLGYLIKLKINVQYLFTIPNVFITNNNQQYC